MDKEIAYDDPRRIFVAFKTILSEIEGRNENVCRKDELISHQTGIGFRSLPSHTIAFTALTMLANNSQKISAWIAIF